MGASMPSQLARGCARHRQPRRRSGHDRGGLRPAGRRPLRAYGPSRMARAWRDSLLLATRCPARTSPTACSPRRWSGSASSTRTLVVTRPGGRAPELDASGPGRNGPLRGATLEEVPTCLRAHRTGGRLSDEELLELRFCDLGLSHIRGSPLQRASRSSVRGTRRARHRFKPHAGSPRSGSRPTASPASRSRSISRIRGSSASSGA